MKIQYKSSAYKQLKKLHKTERAKVIRKIDQLQYHSLIGKKLEGKYSKLRVIRVWPFRIIYKIEKNNIVIQLITHRQSAYKK